MSDHYRYPRPTKLDEIDIAKHAVIEASAGTGKTYTLEHLIVEILLRGGKTEDKRVPVEQILVVTYTERATAELKQRVRSMLERILSHDDIDIPEGESYWEIDEDAQRWLERQLYAFDRAPIHTIHGFCHRILSENAFNLQKLFDQEHADSNLLFDRAFKRALRVHFANDPNLKPYLSAWLRSGTVAGLQKDLAAVCRSTAMVVPRYHEAKLAAAFRAIRTAGVEKMLGEYDGWLQGEMDPYSRGQQVDRVARILEHAMEVLETGEDAPIIEVLERIGETDVINLVHHARDPALGKHVPLLAAVLGNMVTPRAAILQTLQPVMNDVLDDEKAHGLFDFDDMLEMVWRVLKDQTNPNAQTLLRFLRKRYRYALIDEFQDTDPIQWNIFKSIFFESPDHRLFVIGDPKQAIYGFRGADINTYIDARDTVIGSGRASEVHLDENFRSSAALIDAYNTIFDQSADTPFFSNPQIRYDHPVTCGREGLAAYNADGSVVAPIELVRVIPDADSMRADPLKRSHADAIAREAHKILIKEPMQVVNADGERVPVRPDRVFVLTRGRAEETIVAEFLRKHGVPHAFYKREGLFQTREARYILDLLVAVENPYWLANRLKAWATPFFEVPLQRLPFCRDLSETHPLYERLVGWHEMAERRDFDALFNSVLDLSGIVRREIFLKDGERELTNYQHIFEVLQEEATRANLDIDELILRMRGFVDDTRFPESDEDKNVQRLESERHAVQIMTMHKSKGLEADVVFVFGGFSRRPSEPFYNLLYKGRRMLHIGKPYLSETEASAEREAIYEDERLLYVAVTRARYKLYLPYIDNQGGKKDYENLNHTYLRLNMRLGQMVESGLVEEHPGFLLRHEHQVSDEPERPSLDALTDAPPWTPEPALLADDSDRVDHFESLRGTPLLVTSYSRMKAASGGYKAPVEVEEFMADVDNQADEWRDEFELPGGTGPGIFVHTVIEELDFDPLRAGEDFETWSSRREIEELFSGLLRRHGIDEVYAPSARRIVYQSLVAPLTLPDGQRLDGVINADRERREMEFLFPIPEVEHARLDALGEGPWTIDRGFIKGFIDFLFEHDGKVYFADWKTDSLESFAPDALEAHVQENYATQARLYSLAVLKHFRIHDKATYDARFGGYTYFFLRGMAQGKGEGFYARRPAWEELVGYEAKLVSTEFL